MILGPREMKIVDRRSHQRRLPHTWVQGQKGKEGKEGLKASGVPESIR